MGDLLRDAVANETKLGLAAKEFMDTGRLVPDELVIELLKERLSNPDTQVGYILDGFPRSIEQAKLLVEVDEQDLVLNIDVDFAVLLKRLTGRRS
jgi:adenylate kinase